MFLFCLVFAMSLCASVYIVGHPEPEKNSVRIF